MSINLRTASASGAVNVKPLPSLLELVLESDPFPHNADPLIHPKTGARLIPLHILQADYHLKLTPPLKPMGKITHEVLLEIIAFEQHRHFPVFTFYPRLSATEVIPSAVKCVAFNADLAKLGKEALGLGMEALIWFMRDRGSMKKRSCMIFIAELS